MEEEGSDIILNTTLNVTVIETSDSSNNDYTLRASKRCKLDNNASLARFKGVVSQQNGHWGAQIYANHQRIWLGTFKSEKEAAMAYDSAAIKLRRGDSHRNFPWTDHNMQEPNFQNLYTTEDILNMIREGSYQGKFTDFIKTLSKNDGKWGTNHNENLVHGDVQFPCVQLFQKELTPSDVGKLNRLVIPKKYAVKYFPYICENYDQQISLVGGGGGVEDIELVFYDKLMRTWKFRYCYWRSSQSFVFTRGWNRFVKEKKLREKDTITFYTCKCSDGKNNIAQNFFLIDVKHNGEQKCINEEVLESSSTHHQEDHLPVELELNLGKNYCCIVDDSKFNEDKVVNGFEAAHNVEEKRITLFGVQIN